MPVCSCRILSDFIATAIRDSNNGSDYSMGAWAANRVGGIRNYIYSLVSYFHALNANAI